jgi:hypothetical protein
MALENATASSSAGRLQMPEEAEKFVEFVGASQII